MKYAIIDVSKGERLGFEPHLHRLCSNGTKMVINESELLQVNENVDVAASMLGTTALTELEITNKLNRMKK